MEEKIEAQITKRITLPLTEEVVQDLHIGDSVLLSGVLYTGRDAAHKRMFEEGEIPFDAVGQTIYYVGPTPAPPGYAVGSAGPTSSYRMDRYTPWMLDQGIRGIIGKGTRSEEVKQAITAHGAVYFAAVGGAAALIARSIVKSEVLAYPELGPEAVHRYEVVDFPCVVAVDAHGQDIYVEGKKAYLEAQK